MPRNCYEIWRKSVERNKYLNNRSIVENLLKYNDYNVMVFLYIIIVLKDEPNYEIHTGFLRLELILNPNNIASC